MSLTASDSPSLDEIRYRRVLKQNALLRNSREVRDTVSGIKQAIGGGDFHYAAQLWRELEPHECKALDVAESYGGIFTKVERDFLKTVKIVWSG